MWVKLRPAAGGGGVRGERLIDDGKEQGLLKLDVSLAACVWPTHGLALTKTADGCAE